MPALYFGTGVRSIKYGLTSALPFDYVGFLCDAFREANARGCDAVIQEMTDSYEENSFLPGDDYAVAAKQEETIQNLGEMLGVAERFKIMRSSVFRQDPVYQSCLLDIKERADINGVEDCNDYVFLQSASLDYFRKEFNVRAKMGWIVDRENPGRGWDEYRFNTLYQDITRDREFPFVYMDAIRTPLGDRSSPYFMREAERQAGRLPVDPDFTEIMQLELFLEQGTKPQRRYAENLDSVFRRIESLCADGTFSYEPSWRSDALLSRKILAFRADLFDRAVNPSLQPAVCAP